MAKGKYQYTLKLSEEQMTHLLAMVKMAEDNAIDNLERAEAIYKAECERRGKYFASKHSVNEANHRIEECDKMFRFLWDERNAQNDAKAIAKWKRNATIEAKKERQKHESNC